MADLRQYLVWSRTNAHRRRVEVAKREIRRAAALGRVLVSTSWGKDSVALADLAIETLGPVDLMHLASPYELPGNDAIVAHFEERAVVHVLPPARTLTEFVAWLHEVGLGYERETAASISAPKAAKRDRAVEFAHAHGYAVQLLGMRAEESKARRLAFTHRGLMYRRRDGLYVSNPIGWWTVQDSWAWIAARGLPYHPLYDCETHGLTRESLRNSGWLTTIGVGEGRIAWLRRHYHDQYRALVAEFPRVALLG